MIEDGKGGGRFQNVFPFFSRVAERAFGRSVPGDLVIVPVCVNLTVFIFKNGGITQFYVALGGWFLMNFMGSKTFESKIPAYGKIGHSRGLQKT